MFDRQYKFPDSAIVAGMDAANMCVLMYAICFEIVKFHWRSTLIGWLIRGASSAYSIHLTLSGFASLSHSH